MNPADSLAAVRRARSNLERARARLRAEIVDAFNVREVPVDQIADAAGYTRQRIYQIVAEESRGPSASPRKDADR